MGAKGVFKDAFEHLTSRGYFIKGERLLSVAFMLELGKDIAFCKKLKRIPENWKTAFNVKSIKYMKSLEEEFVLVDLSKEDNLLRPTVSRKLFTLLFIYIRL